MNVTLFLLVKKQIYQQPLLARGCRRAWRNGKAFIWQWGWSGCPSNSACGPAPLQELLPPCVEQLSLFL